LQIDDGRLDPLLESFGYVLRDLHAIHRSETEDDLLVRVFDRTPRNTVRIETHLDAHIASRRVRLEVDVRLLERLFGGRSGRSCRRRKYYPGQCGLTVDSKIPIHGLCSFPARILNRDLCLALT